MARAAEFVGLVTRDLAGAPLNVRDRAMIDYAVKLTRAPASVTRADLDVLRA